MKKQTGFILAMLLFCVTGFNQSPALVKIDTSRASVEHWQKWMSNLNEMGVEKKNDSFFVKEEVVRLLKDSVYRNAVYPQKYNWPAAVALLQQMELKKAFWHLINLYQSDTERRNIVVGSFIMYDSLMDMDKILLNTFYTYAFTDPEVCRIKNNKQEIYRPDLLEKKLRTTREIINYIWINRKSKTAKKIE